MANELIQPSGYGDFLREVKAQIRERQYQALRAANKELLALYWWLGEAISRRQAEQGWGKAVVETLAQDLQAEFPGRNGFSAQNLWLMRQFYNEYATKPKLQPLVGEISWAKNLLIMARCKDDLEREFYVRATAHFGWTKNVLQHQLDNQSYRQYLAGQTNFDAVLPDSIKAQALLAVKDHYRNRAIESAQVIEELIAMAKEFREALKQGEKLGLNESERAFYDALADNESAVRELGDDILKKIALELTEKLRNSTTVDWQKRDSVRARLRNLVRITLRRYKYPPDKTEAAIELVLKQAEVLSDEWSKG